MDTKNRQSGFSLIEVLIVIGIISILAGIILVAIAPARKKARDTKRKVDLAQMGRLLYGSSCYLPNGGAGDYDIVDLVPELSAKYPQYAQYASLIPKDPLTGTASQTNYRYQINANSQCAVYANFENESEPITLPGLTAPTAGTGTGVLQALSNGPNGTSLYYQISK